MVILPFRQLAGPVAGACPAAADVLQLHAGVVIGVQKATGNPPRESVVVPPVLQGVRQAAGRTDPERDAVRHVLVRQAK
eukprot:9614657-Lingulodinium_polyedra.AAC.1